MTRLIPVHIDALVALLFLAWKGSGSSEERKQRTRDLVGEFVDGKVREAIARTLQSEARLREHAVREEREEDTRNADAEAAHPKVREE